MAKKKKVAIPNLRKEVQDTIKDLKALEKDLEKVQKNLEGYLKRPRPGGRVGGEDDWFVELTAMTRRRR